MSGYVYLIGTPLFGWYKIGKSKTPEIRVANLGILLPFKIKVIGIWKAENHHLLESTLHEIYNDHRINGEWFEFDKKDVYKIFDKIPKEAIIFPTDELSSVFDNFSNIDEDVRKFTKNPGKVLGVRVQKLRGDFTPEEREERKKESMRLKQEKKLKKLLEENTEL